MPVTSEANRKKLQNIETEDVEKAMELFDRKFRKDFEEGRWRKYTLLNNGKSYPPKDLLRCVIAVMNNSLYDRDSVTGGGDSINKYFTKLGFAVLDSEKPVDNKSKVLLRKATTSISSTGMFSGEIPTREDIEKILWPLGGEADEDTFKEAVGDFFKKEKRPLRADWWEITKRNLIEWSKKG